MIVLFSWCFPDVLLQTSLSWEGQLWKKEYIHKIEDLTRFLKKKNKKKNITHGHLATTKCPPGKSLNKNLIKLKKKMNFMFVFLNQKIGNGKWCVIFAVQYYQIMIVL